MKTKSLILICMFLFSFTFISAIDISTCQELQDINNDLTANYDLINNIDCSATSGWNEGAGFLPIGNGSEFVFTGVFNGHKYIISNLYINRAEEFNVGLFKEVYGSIYNVKLENLNISGYGEVGGLVGGAHDEIIIENCSTSGNLYVTFGGAGGLVGRLTIWGGYISNSYSSVNLFGPETLGGLVGILDNTGSSSVTNCYATGEITQTGEGGEFSGTIGGLVGNPNWDASGGRIINSYYTGKINNISSWNVGGLVGSLGGSVTNSFWDIETSELTYSSAGTGKTTSEMKTQSTFTDAGWDFDTVWYMDDGYPLFLWDTEEEPEEPPQQQPSGIGGAFIRQQQLPSEEVTGPKVSIFSGILGWFQNIINWFKGLF